MRNCDRNGDFFKFKTVSQFDKKNKSLWIHLKLPGAITLSFILFPLCAAVDGPRIYDFPFCLLNSDLPDQTEMIGS